MKRFPYALGIARLLVGGAFLAAGLLKVSDPAAFASAIDSFRLVPAAASPFLALSLPYLEIMLGAMLLTGIRRRTAAFAAVLLLTIYSGALASALMRGLPLECDCFGSATPAPLALLRDAVLLTASATLYRGEFRRVKP